MKTSPEKALFLSPSGIGNYLMQSPTIEAFKRAFPQSEVTVWVAPRGTKALAENDPNVDFVIEAPVSGGITHHIQQSFRLSREKYSTGIVLYPGQPFKSAAYLFVSGIPTRIGHRYPFRGNPNSRFLLTDPVEVKENTHDIEQNLRLLEPLENGKQKIENGNYELQIPKKCTIEAKILLRNIKPRHDATLIGIHAGSASGFEWKQWPLENFAEVAAALIEKREAHILIFGGPAEKSQKQHLKQLVKSQVKSHMSNVSVVSASLLTTAAVMQHCALMLSNDSGLMHLAAASGVKTFGIFGPTDETRTGPRGVDSHTIRASGTKPVYDVNNTAEFGSGPHPSLALIEPSSVIDKIDILK